MSVQQEKLLLPRRTSNAEFCRLANKAIIDLAQAANYYVAYKDSQARQNLLRAVHAMDREAGIISIHKNNK